MRFQFFAPNLWTSSVSYRSSSAFQYLLVLWLTNEFDRDFGFMSVDFIVWLRWHPLSLSCDSTSSIYGLASLLCLKLSLVTSINLF
jgi:hypothetical protein